MLQRLMPRSDDFFSDFEAQAAAVVEGAVLLKALLDDFTDVPAKCQAIKDVEHRADDITHRAFERLHTQFITPFDRSEIHRILSRIDDVLDLADAAAERLGLYDLDSVLPEARELCAVLVEQSRKMEEAVRGLRNMKKDPETILAACQEMNKLENQADTLTRKTMAKLLKRRQRTANANKGEGDHRPPEGPTGPAEGRGNRIRGLVLEHA